MNLFIIPANSNQGKLIFSLFTKFDLILVSSGFAITLLSLMIFTISSFQMFVIIMLPALITALLVVPIPNYHNVYTVIKEIIQFFYKRRNYRWEGWCSRDEFK
ncbi:MAG: hypothetical protein IKE73_05095 [Bacilli bacterium]|nr:hypothetical protein [Bacilli bacterium]